jgi:hypothetical protein
MSYDALSARIRHWRTRLPKTSDLRDTRRYELVDRVIFTQKPFFPVDLREAPPVLNQELTYTCALNTPTGPRVEFCSYLPTPYETVYDDPEGFFSVAAAPSGYMIRSYPLLRDPEGGRPGNNLVYPLFPQERVILESRSIGNTTASLGFSSCENPNAVTQETYTFIGAGENQVLVATNAFQDTIIRTDWFRINQTSPNRIAASQGRAYGEFIIQPLQVEFATGLWAGTTDVWMRTLDDGRGLLDLGALDNGSHFSEVSFFKARSNRRMMPQLL